MIGRLVDGRYQVRSRIARGGMATVYLATDLRHQRQVAIKVLHPELAAAVGRERFLREVAIVARLNHPHILLLHDSDEAGGLLYFVMPRIMGESLRQRLSRHRRRRSRPQSACRNARSSALGSEP